MTPRLTTPLLSWLLLPAAALLVQSALTLDRQPYTGIVLRDDYVAEVIPGSPGARAGLSAGDRLEPGPLEGAGLGGPLSNAQPGRPLTLTRVSNGTRTPVWIAPEPLPASERRMMVALLLVASGFVLLGGWVWSERRDTLARAFYLLCLAFAGMITPPPRLADPALQTFSQTAPSVMALYLPALFIHFFALFPESRAPRRVRTWVGVGYGLATFFALFSLAGLVSRAFGTDPVPDSFGALHAAAGIWFALGMLTALVVFVISYRKADSPDTRRRLRVVLFGTILGAGPLAALIALRNLSPGTSIPGERWAVVMTLLVPASFAWASVIHRVFDFRVALRAAAVTAIVVLCGLAAYGAGEWIVAAWGSEWGSGIAGGGLAFVAVVASLAGPAAPWLGSLGARVVPGDTGATLAEWASVKIADGAPAPGTRRADVADSVLGEACDAVEQALRLDGCTALLLEGDAVRAVDGEPGTRMPQPGPGLARRTAQLARSGLHALHDSPLEPGDREALDMAGVAWLLPIGRDPVRAVMLLGRRLAGPWLGRRETLELERFAQHLSVALETAALRREVKTRGAIDRALKEAGVIQAHLLPKRVPVHPSLDCAAAALSCEPVGGDYYDFVEGPGRDFTLGVGDAAGKGVPAALLVALLQGRFRDHARRGLSPGQMLRLFNEDLVGLDQPEKFVGLVCARVEVRAGRVWFANAGLTPPLVRRASGAFEEIAAGGTLLGVQGNSEYPDTCVSLGAGDVVIVYTDGLTEARRGTELFGVERVQAILEESAGRRAADILQALIEGVRAWANRPLDDLTVVVLKQLSRPGTGPQPPGSPAAS